ncbi:Hint domain-containing protein [Phaeovulum vinaykumarii]|uniref:Ca2+-binding protein, RTX toxin-related n=1 Tax=Phaeovulum vinaykumarii TaxID=407234 RepID=A0A1N7M452_9RHOB|nr:Hint domain-containing protein [Phaeovulum vinaykumarii]SIS80731.1 Ca2+-binding protein, RTX toxin-related [Phaeovulum vinaykumarii]SOC08997.1 Ca2+-binding RTX toxin-like protein [Phaeovulum vinaykumarii]
MTYSYQDYAIYAWDLSDISASSSSLFRDSATGMSDPRGQTFTIATGARVNEITVRDNDASFNDGDNSQTLNSSETLEGSSYTPSDGRMAPEYAYVVRPLGSTDPGDFINVYAFEMSDNDVVGIVSSAALTPGVIYEVISYTYNCPSVPYDSLATYDDGDGYVEGTTGDDLIDAAYTGDPEGDMIDAGDAVLAGEGPDDDIVLAGAGDDTVLAGAGDDEIHGEDGDDYLSGGDGDDYLIGGAGDDTLLGGAGNDTFQGNAGLDVIDYSNSDAGVNVDLSTGTLSGGEATGDVIEGGIDGVIGSDYDDTLTGFDHQGTDASDVYTNVFHGNGGDDLISGAGGDDSLYGGSDDDTISGGAGDDVIYGGNAGASTTTDPNAATPLVLSASNVLAGSQTGADGCARAGDSATYLNVATTEDGRTVMAKLVLVDADSGLAVDLTGGAGSEILLNGNNDASDAGKSATFRLEFYDQATGQAIDISSIATFGDLDQTATAEQVILSAAGYSTYGTTADTSLDVDNDGSTITVAGTEENDPSDQDAWFSASFTDAGSIEFTLVSRDVNSGFTFNGSVIDDPVVVDLVDGDDLLDGGAGDDTIFGEAGNDTITGGDGADVIDAGDDRDTIHGAAGDTVSGGAGGDDWDVLDLTGQGAYRVVNTTTDSNGNGIDGTIEFLDAGGNVTGTLEFTEIEEITGNTPDGYVDGTSGADLIDTAYTGDPDGDMIDAGDAVLAGEGPDDDIVRAGAGDDTVLAGAGADDVYAGDGNDEVHGGEGDDILRGEAGDDALYGEGGSNTLDGGLGDDTLVGGSNSDSILGGDGADVIDAGNAQDTVSGGAGDDDILAGEGDDLVSGDAGRDTIAGGSGQDTLRGGADDDVVAGEDGDDRLYGEDGNDVLSGGQGQDSLDGGAGDDTLTGGTGVDTLFGGQDSDTFIVTSAEAGMHDHVDGDEDADDSDWDVLDLTGAGPVNVIYDTTNPENGTVQFLDTSGNVTGTMTFENIERVVTDQGDGYVEGTSGADLIDTAYTGDPEGDMVDAGDAILTGDAPDDDRILAGEGDDTVHAGVGDDTIWGDDGNDQIFGEDGDDSMSGGAGQDTLTGGDGNDQADGGAGDDVIDTSGTTDPLPDQGYPGLFPADTDPDNDRDTVHGGDGNDTITTGDDADVIYGEDGDDVIDAGIDADTISGGAGNDQITGGEGSDLIDAGAGDDTIYAGLPNGYPDVLNVPDDTDLVPTNGLDTVHGGDGNDVIYGADDDDELHGDAGNDYIDGGIDEDVITGGTGNDTIIGGQGADTMSGGDDRDTFLVSASGDGIGDVVDGNEGGDDFDTLDLTGSGPLRVVFSPSNPEDGTVYFYDASGAQTGSMDFTNIEKVIPCFTPGTLVATPRGEVLAEDLKVGDKVITRDNGIQEIRWAGRCDLTHGDLLHRPHLKPILIKAGSLGNGLPEHDMRVSPNHRMLVANDRTALYFEEHEVLVSAKHLVDNRGVLEVETLGTSYLHFMFDHHEVILANGAWTESFQPGDYTLGGMGNAQRNEIFELFPELKTDAGRASYTTARRTLKRHEAALLIR